MASNIIDISIVIPCFNHGDYLLEALSSVEQYAGNNYEVIIVNDGSTEPNTKEVLNSLRERGYIILDQENQGLAQARNNGIELAQGRYILPLDSDNKIRPQYITKGIEILDRFPEVGVVYGNVEFFGDRTGIWYLPDFDLKRLMASNYIDACAVFRKSIWQSCGGYDRHMPDQLGYEDWEFWLRVARHGWHFHHIPEVMYDYRVREDSMVQNCKLPDNQKRLVHYIWTKHIDLFAANLVDLIDVIAEKEFIYFTEIAKLQAELQVEKSNFQQINHELARRDASCKELQSNLHSQNQELEKTQSQLNQVQIELEKSGSRLAMELQSMRVELEQAKNRILSMESSKFWQLRMYWHHFKRVIGLSNEV